MPQRCAPEHLVKQEFIYHKYNRLEGKDNQKACLNEKKILKNTYFLSLKKYVLFLLFLCLSCISIKTKQNKERCGNKGSCHFTQMFQVAAGHAGPTVCSSYLNVTTNRAGNERCL